MQNLTKYVRILPQ